MPALKLEKITGIDLISENIPANATPPAPIYLMYLLQISPGAISLIKVTASG
jgi:hypothetical protein